VTFSDPDRIVIQAASTDPDSKAIEALVMDALDMVHAGETMLVGSAESALGWTFYTVSASRPAIRRLASFPGSEIMKVKGDSVEQRFVHWLNKQAKKKGLGERVHFALASDLRSSRYGLF
jgi:hypothetical protein